jgi:hypothetical protein
LLRPPRRAAGLSPVAPQTRTARDERVQGDRVRHSVHLCGDLSHEHRILGARREPVRGAAQGEPDRTRGGPAGG